MLKLLAQNAAEVHVCGHRGHSIGAPENTIAALVATREHGGNSAEIDCVLTEDDEIVLMHDQTLDRTTNGTGLVSSRSLADIRKLDAGSWFDGRFVGERVPTLAEAIEFAKTYDFGLVVEIKEARQMDRFVRRLGAVLSETGGADHLVMISFDHVILRDLKDVLPGIRTEGITHARHADFVGVAKAARLDSVSMEHQMFMPEDGAALHKAGVAVRFHLQRPAYYDRYEALGIDLLAPVSGYIAAGVIDTISGDDVGFLAALKAAAIAK
jgi:glycerophosphoryl diester phosphodiesterase